MGKESNPHLEEYKTLQKEISQLKIKVDDIVKKREYWFEKKESLKKEIRGNIKVIKDMKAEIDKRFSEVADLKSNRNKHNGEVKTLIKKIKKLNKEKGKVFKAYNIKVDPKKLQEKINSLEKKVEVETNFKNEQKLMDEIKKLKKSYDESSATFKLVEEAQQLEKDIRESRKKADEFHKQIKTVTQDQSFAKFLDLSKQITALKKTQEEAFQIFIEYKNTFLKTNLALKEKYEHLNKMKSFMEKDKALVRLGRELKKKEYMKHKAEDVEEKIKKKKKLTTDDLLAFQGSDE